MKGTRTQRKHEIKGLNSCSQSMNLQLKKMNILKFGAMMICLLDYQNIPSVYVLHIHFQSSLLQHTSLNNKELNNRWLVSYNTHILYVANTIFNIIIQLQEKLISNYKDKYILFMCITNYAKTTLSNLKEKIRRKTLNVIQFKN